MDPNLDPDEFKQLPSSHKPQHWAVAVRRASAVHSSYIRFLLEMHYDKKHAAKYSRSKTKRRNKDSMHTGIVYVGIVKAF